MEEPIDSYESEESSGGGLDLKVLVLYGLGRGRLIVAFFLLLGTIGGLVAAAAKPNVYQSVALLHFTPGLREGLTPEALAGANENWLPSIGITDEIVLLQDPVIYEEVAQKLGVKRVLEKPDPAAADTAETAPHVRLLHSIQSYLNAGSDHEACLDEVSDECVRVAGLELKAKTAFNAQPRSNVIEIYHESFSPERAQEFAQALLESFVEHHSEIFSATPHAAHTEKEMLAAKDRYTEATEHYREHRHLCGFQSLGEETTELRSEITQLRAELRGDRSRRSQVVGELEEYEKYLEQIPKEIDRITPAVYGPNTEYDSASRLLLDRKMELVLAVGSADRSQSNRQRQVLEQQIEALETELEKMSAVSELKPELVEMVPNPEYFEYRRKVDDRVAEDRGLGLTIEEKEKNLRRLTEQLDLAGQCEKHHDEAEDHIRDAEEELTALKARYFRLDSLSDLDAQGQSNLRVYRSALLPLGKSGPQRAKTVLMGVFGGFALGAGIAVLRQLIESRVRYGRTLENQLGLPLLAVVPENANLRKLARRKASAA